MSAVALMPRFVRIVVTDEPYHITHRGNHRGQIFFEEGDREAYIAMLGAACNRFGLDVWGYYLMSNHIHLIAVPRRLLSMAGGVGRTHMRYSRWVNRERAWSGHLWANRFHSSPLDEQHLWNAIRYVEQNPVRAGLVTRCEDWPWSSARAHAGLLNYADPLLSTTDPFPGEIPSWSGWVNACLEEEICQAIRTNTSTGRPTGNDEFIQRIATALERELSPPRKRGRPRKPQPGPDPMADLFS